MRLGPLGLDRAPFRAIFESPPRAVLVSLLLIKNTHNVGRKTRMCRLAGGDGRGAGSSWTSQTTPSHLFVCRRLAQQSDVPPGRPPRTALPPQAPGGGVVFVGLLHLEGPTPRPLRPPPFVLPEVRWGLCRCLLFFWFPANKPLYPNPQRCG